MPEIPQRVQKPCESTEIRCHNCGYCPAELSAEVNTRIPQGMNEVELMLMEDELDFFEVIGCDHGNVMCPECACEFTPIKSKLTVPKAMKFDGGANL